MPTTSSRRSPAKPIEWLELKVSFRGDRVQAALIKEAFPSAKVRGGTCEVVISGEQPLEVAKMARELLEKVRGAVEKPAPSKRL